jgi:hypothetical protein
MRSSQAFDCTQVHPTTNPGNDRDEVSGGDRCIEICRAPVDMEVATGGVHIGRLKERSPRRPGRDRDTSNGAAEDHDPGDGVRVSH